MTDLLPCREAFDYWMLGMWFKKEAPCYEAYREIFWLSWQAAWKAAQSNAPSVPEDVAEAVRDAQFFINDEFEGRITRKTVESLIRAASKPQVEAVTVEKFADVMVRDLRPDRDAQWMLDAYARGIATRHANGIAEKYPQGVKIIPAPPEKSGEEN